ncbi:MAG: V-type ATPase subunit [Clostridia bacterium]
MNILKRKKDVDFIFASSSVNVRNNKCPLSDTIEKALVADDYNAAMRVFYESGLALEGEDFTTALDKKTDELYDFLNEIGGSDCAPIISFLKIKHDVLILKSAIKSFVFNQIQLDETPTDFSVAVDAMVRDNNFSPLLNPVLITAAEKALEDSTSSQDPQTIDFILDKALFECRSEIAENSGIKYLLKLNQADIDTKNLCAIFRIKRLGISVFTAKELLYQGGNIKPDDILLLLSEPEKSIYALRKTAYGDIYKELIEASASPSECEIAFNRFYFNLLETAQNITYGAEKVIAYAVLYEKKVRDLRMILTGKKVGISPEKIKERL